MHFSHGPSHRGISQHNTSFIHHVGILPAADVFISRALRSGFFSWPLEITFFVGWLLHAAEQVRRKCDMHLMKGLNVRCCESSTLKPPAYVDVWLQGKARKQAGRKKMKKRLASVK